MAKNIDIPDGWEVKKLGEVGKIIGGGTPDTKIDKYWSNNTEKNSIIWLTPTEITNKYTTDSIRKITLQGLNRSSAKILPINTILITTRATIGAISIAKIECTTNQGFQSLVCNHKYVDYEFMYYMLHQHINTLKKLANGSTFMEISANEIRKIKLILPPLAEQEKIAEILSLWDKAIEQTRQLILYKEKQKKGLMQNLLTGRKRLNGWNDKWKTVKLGEICNITTGRLDANAMEENGVYPFFTCAKDIFKINTFAFDTEALLISGNGANVGYIHYYYGKFNAYQRTYVLSNFNEYIIFLKYYLENYLHIRIDKEKKTGNTPYITLDTISKMSLHIPQYQNEQKAIADILCKADEEIELLNKQLDLYTEQKKGLMQNLLTGRVRV